MAIPLENVVSINVEGIVEAAVRQGLQFAVEKAGCAGVDALLSRLAAHDEWALGYFAYSCAHNLADSVAALDGNISEAYVLGLEGNDCGSASFPVVLIVSVACRTAALESIVSRINGALPRMLVEVTGLGPDLSAGFMDVQVIEDEDVSMRRGLGAAVHSLWAPALRVWVRRRSV
ncbi:MAG: hypothetical protein HPY55_01045 [Firmicutes bacterium]|nr:hypothetical protein [Bacillota bacterium]